MDKLDVIKELYLAWLDKHDLPRYPIEELLEVEELAKELDDEQKVLLKTLLILWLENE